MKKVFNIDDWLPEPDQQQKNDTATPARAISSNFPTADSRLEATVQAIEQAGIDISVSYEIWVSLGFSLASELQESGREYFHRISRFHPEYSHKEADEQYTKCLKASGSGVTIASFYHHAKSAGIDISMPKPERTSVQNQTTTSFIEANNTTQEGENEISAINPSNGPQPPISSSEEEEEKPEPMPLFPDTIFDNLPLFLQKVVQPAKSKEERDILLLGSLTTTSACFPKLYGIYDDKKLSPNLYVFITARASAGKGRLSLCKLLVQPIHKQMREKAKALKLQHASEMAEFNLNKGDAREKPAKPPERMLFLPANNSTTGIFQLLSDNKGRGLIFETEGDTLTNSLKSDHGNFSDGLRNAWQGETISYYRRTDREYVDIESPCLSVVLSGTPKQIPALIPSAENGLFSRFIFYYMNLQPEWKRVFYKSSSEGIDDYYLTLGEEFYELYRTLIQNEPIKVVLTEEQEESFHQFFSQLHHKYLHLQTEDYVATVRRMGVIAFRFAMLFTAFRIMEDGDVNKVRECEDQDFDSVLQLIGVLVRHSSKVFSSLPEEQALPKRSNRKERFLEFLPAAFSRQEYIQLADNLKIPQKTAEKYIYSFVKAGFLHRESNGNYFNSSKRENGENGESGESEEK